MKIKDAYNEYINYMSLNRAKPTTVLGIKRKFKNHILPVIGELDIEKIEVSDFMNWQKYVINLGYSESFEKNIQSIILSFFNYLERFYNIKNLARIVGNFKSYNVTENKELNVWTIKEFNKFIKKIDEPVYHALFNTLFFTGIRKGEALSLNFNDIEKRYISINSNLTKEFFDGKRLRLKPKTKKSIRKIRIDYKLSKELNLLQEYYTTKYGYFNKEFFVFGGEKPIATTTLDRKKNYYCDLAKVKRIRLHDFRHSHATILYQKKIRIKLIQERLGHADISTTLNTYVHLTDKDEKKVIRALSFLRLNF